MLNKVMIIGRLGRDPEIRYTQSGKAVGNFSVATDSGRGDQKKTEWHKVVVWDKLAELCGRYLTKGRMVYVEGRIQTREWEKDGERRFSTEIIAREVTFLGGNEAGDGQGSRGGYGQQQGGYGNQGGGYGQQRQGGHGGYGNQRPPAQGNPDVVPYADDDDVPF